MPDGKVESLRAIDRAVSLDPESAHFLGYKSYLLSHFGQYPEALRIADTALQRDPARRIALLGRANAFTKTAQWWAAETAARRMLELAPGDTAALNLLAQALRFQNRHEEGRAVVSRILALVPEDPFGQTNAGYEALNAGDHRRANQHFLNALRINPHSDHARRGLLQALRARSWFYRVNLRLIEFFGDIRRKPVWMRAIFVLLMIGTGGLVLGLWLLYLVVALTLQPISNFLLLLEPAGRRALKPRERAWAMVTGLAACLLVVLCAASRFRPVAWWIVGYLALFASGVYVPAWIEAWQAWRERKRQAAENLP
jgi:tetratricopeptide (TPR) repeat protein